MHKVSSFNSNPDNSEPLKWTTFIFQVKVFIHVEEVETIGSLSDPKLD